MVWGLMLWSLALACGICYWVGYKYHQYLTEQHFEACAFDISQLMNRNDFTALTELEIIHDYIESIP